MEPKPRDGFKGALIVWVVGLAVGILAGTATARLLMADRQGDVPPEGTSIRDRVFGDRD